MQKIRNIECTVYEKIEETVKFSSFLEVNPLNLGINNFFGKNKNVTFYVSLLYKSVQKIRKIECIVSEKNERTDERTDGRTNGRTDGRTEVKS